MCAPQKSLLIKSAKMQSNTNSVNQTAAAGQSQQQQSASKVQTKLVSFILY